MIRSRYSALVVAAVLTACGGGGGDDGGGQTPPPPQPTTFSVSGTITAASGLVVDSDVNDPNAPFKSNDTGSTAQQVPNPVTLAGYVNEAGAGATGRSRTDGDLVDYYKFTGLAGQVVSMVVGDVDNGDPDLFLYDSAGNQIDLSMGVGTYEQIPIKANGQYFVGVEAYDGASNYLLTIGQATAGTGAGALSSEFELVPGEAIVKLKDTAGAAQSKSSLTALSATHGVTIKAGSTEREMLISLESPAVSGYANRAVFPADTTERIGKFATQELREKWETMMAIKALRRDKRIAYAEPNYIVRTNAVPNDQYYRLQWHYPFISLPAASDITRGSASVIVAVVDTGVLLGHPDLQGQLVDGFDFIRSTTMSRDNDGIDANPDDPGDASQANIFHGTHVAGTIAAASNNTAGVAGVAPLVKIMPIRVLGQGGGTSYDIVQGVRYAAGLANDSGRLPAKKADVINLSIGGEGFLQSSQDAYTAARQAGSIIVAAAGNDNVATPGYPASYNGVISVSATSMQKTRSSFSNFGASIDIAAPGGDFSDSDGDGNQDLVFSTCGDATKTPIGFTYCFAAGTSMAAPHMAGVVALMKSVNPAGVTPDSVDQIIASGRITEDLGAAGRDNDFGYGLVDARKAVIAAQGAAPPATPTLAVTPRALNFSATDSTLELVLSNSGGGTLQVPGVVGSPASLITVTRGTVDANGVGRYIIRANRTGLADGTYQAQIDITSNGGNVRVAVAVQVLSGTMAASNAGYHYVLLVKPDSDPDVEPPYQVSAGVNNGTYTYNFTNVASGTYIMIAGSDPDNDLDICDEGEACGAFRTIDQPTEITVDRNLTSMDFFSGFDVTIRTQSAGADSSVYSHPRRLNTK